MAPFEFASDVMPDDVQQQIRGIKKELRRQMGDYRKLFAEVSRFIEAEVENIEAVRNSGDDVWPVVDFADVANARVPQQMVGAIHRRGCVVIRNHFPRELAHEWDKGLVAYLEANNFDRQYRGPGDDFFGSLAASRPEIFPIYWSHPQMAARQHERMAAVQSFLNHLWKYDSEGKRWFDPDQDTLYPDRIRRRPPGTTSQGLGAHTDSGALERWLHPAYHRVYRHLLAGNFAAYDPWDAAYRPDVNEYAGSSTLCSAFRTFQGWTALSDMKRNHGVLQTVPIPAAMAYILLRPLQDDVPEDELCGVKPRQALPISEQWHPLLMRALTSIPDIEAGSSVWWHCDLVHAVGAVESQTGWGNVMYIPAAPMCEKNATYAKSVASAFATGSSPEDFPKEDYEVQWKERFLEADLNPIGRRGLCLND